LSHPNSRGIVRDFTLSTTSGGGVFGIVFGNKRYIRLNEELANKGVEFQYGRFGSISGVRLHFQYNPRFLGTRWRASNVPDEWKTAQDLLNFYDNGNSLGSVREVFENIKIYFYVDGKKPVGRISNLGNMIIANINGIKRRITVKHFGDFIDINGFGTDDIEFTYKKRTQEHDEWVVIEAKSKDLHELINFRNDWHEQEL
jgi:hypothetical protein